MNLDAGYLYVASGAQYIDEALTSAQSVRSTDKNAHTTLITYESFQSSLFDAIRVREGSVTDWYSGLDFRTAHVFDASPYSKTLFLDADTYVYESCQPIFYLLDFFDVCVAASAVDVTNARVGQRVLHACVPYNMGVVAFRTNAATDELFHAWSNRYR